MRTSEEQCIQALREATDRLGESPTKAQYEELGLTPSSATIIRAVGGWNDAKEMAGLETNPSRGTRVRPKPDEVDVSVTTPWDELTVDQRWYYKNAEADNQYELRRRAGLREMITEYKSESDGCQRCDEDSPVCLDFHHPDPDEKEMAVNKTVPFGYSRKDIRSEMEKCVILCANCHRREHFDDVGDTESELGTTVFGGDPTAEEDFGLGRWPETLDGLRQWSYAYRRAVGCRRCGGTDPRCLQFHHVDQSEKSGSVGNMITNGSSRERLRSEVEKCEVLCVNCHREEHATASLQSDSV